MKRKFFWKLGILWDVEQNYDSNWCEYKWGTKVNPLKSFKKLWYSCYIDKLEEERY